jgi:hypothetical protein
MPRTRSQVFLCHRQMCCREWEIPILLPPQECPLGRYERKYSPKPDAWPLEFACFDCGRKSNHSAEAITPSLLNELPHELRGKALWQLEIKDVEKRYETITIIYTIAPPPPQITERLLWEFAQRVNPLRASKTLRGIQPLPKRTIIPSRFDYDLFLE